MKPSAQLLIVDDDPALRLMLKSILEQHHFQVKLAGDTEEALAVLASSTGIEVVLLDLGLPPHPHEIREGMALLTHMQSMLMAMKIIVLTGQDHSEAALAAIREGAFDFLAKPASAESIVSSVRRALLFLQAERELGALGITRIALNAQVKAGLKGVRVDAEERLVRQVLKETGFNVNQSAKRLGVKRENIYYFLKKFGIVRDA
ncbi:MAG: response regulator [Burkholderiales bacterium]|nr:response regulator [Burkholderiales bacterium]